MMKGFRPQRIVGAVVSNAEGCAKVGGDILKMGGSAVDAIIATMLCEGIKLPHSMGVGGGFIATLYHKDTNRVETLIAREAAPLAAHENMFKDMETITGEIGNENLNKQISLFPILKNTTNPF